MWQSRFVRLATIAGVAAAAALIGACTETDSSTGKPIDTTHMQFINCKIENLQYTLLYQYCREREALADEAADPDEMITDPDPGGMITDQGGMITDPDQGGMITDPDQGGMITDPDDLVSNPDPGGMLTDPDPGGMITDPDGGFIAFAPTSEHLAACALNNVKYKALAEKCGAQMKERLENQETP